MCTLHLIGHDIRMMCVCQNDQKDAHRHDLLMWNMTTIWLIHIHLISHDIKMMCVCQNDQNDTHWHGSLMWSLAQTWLIHMKHDTCTCNMTHSYVHYIWLVMTSECHKIWLQKIWLTHVKHDDDMTNLYIQYIWLVMTSEWCLMRQFFWTYTQSRSLNQKYDQYSM